MKKEVSRSLGWGKSHDDHGVAREMWDMQPVFQGERVTIPDRLKLLCYPKKFLLYRWIKRAKKNAVSSAPFRILDVGCGTGATVIDLKKLFGRAVDVVGVDVIRLQVDLAREKLKSYGVWATVEWFDGRTLPFADQSFDAVHTSDVLGHVANVPEWLVELARVLKPGGALAMFSESALGQHAWIRHYLLRRGLNIDPHAEYHISLYTKHELEQLAGAAGFQIQHIYSAIWPSFFVYPDMYADAMANRTDFPILRALNRILFSIKKKLHPVSTAAIELYSLLEMLTIGRWLETQGYIILARKRPDTEAPEHCST